jgi:predicted NUDIX family phosphoesterase
MAHPSEQILVVPADFARAFAPNTYNAFPYDGERTFLERHSFREREEAETNQAFKQVIPYVIVRHHPHYLLTQRTNKQQEKRLHNLYSIGQGGHVNDKDFAHRDPILTGLLREIREEYWLSAEYGCSPIGVINDDSNDVGKVHLGLVYELRVSTPKLEVAEEGKHIASWATVAELQSRYAEMENWSKIVMDQVIMRI